MEVRALGLVLNERKTYTYGAENYRSSLTSFIDAEQRLFTDGGSPGLPSDLGFLDTAYGAGDGDAAALMAPGASSLGRSLDEDGSPATDAAEISAEVEPQLLRAAQRAWELWRRGDEPEERQAGQDAAIAQSLLGRALPTLGAAGESRPLELLPELLRLEPALTPQVAAYLAAYGQHGQRARADLRIALDEAVTGNILSAWQGMWLAHVAGGVNRSQSRHRYEDWLAHCAAGSHDGLAATAAAALGRIGGIDSDIVATAVDRVGPEWRRLAFWGLTCLDRARAENTADDELDRLLLAAVTAQ